MQPSDLETLLKQVGKTREVSIPPEFREHIEAIIPQLRALRRHRHSTARRGALLALLHLGGEAALEQADLAALLRLVRIKATRDAPYAFDACFNSWLTVRGGDQRGIMRVLGLTDAVPATYPLGEILVSHLSHGGPSRQETFDHVFMSPELNGWTVIRGSSCDPDESPRVAAWVERLSDEYGQAQAYFYGSQADGDAWLVGEQGRIIRRYSSNQPKTSFGSPLPIEQHWLKYHGLPAPAEQLLDDKNESFIDSVLDYMSDCSAPVMAAELSIDPVWGRNWPWPLQIRGNALIARTAAGVQQSVLRGCYDFAI